jgi:Tol biopolymer transport system component
VSPQTGVEQPLSTQRWDLIGFIEWLRDGGGLIVSANDQLANPTQLWKIPYPLAEAQKMTTDLNAYRGVSITADGRSLVSVQDTRLANIYTIEPGADPGSARMLNSEIINSNQGGAAYDWTPDGKIVYTSGLSGTYELWIMEADGTGNRQLTVDAYARRLSVSPDGRYIVFGSYGNKGSHIWRADITGGNLKQLTNGGEEASPRCSPDGKWVVYEGIDSSELRSWKVPIDGGEPVAISDKGFYRPAISPDGKFMANLHNAKQNHRTELVITNLETGELIKTLNGSYIQWMPDSRNLLCFTSQDKNLIRQPIDGGPPKPLTNFQSEFTFACALSPDGRRLVLSRGSFSSDVVLIRFK